MKRLRTIFRSIIMIVIITSMISLVYWAGNQIPIVEDIEKSILEVDLTDVYMSNKKRLNSFEVDTSIVIVNIKWLKRDSIGLLLSKIASYKPKVTGINVYFYNLKGYGDSLLIQGLDEQPFPLFVAKLDYSNFNKENNCYQVLTSHEAFIQGGVITSSLIGNQNFAQIYRVYKEMDVEQESIQRYFEPNLSGGCDTIGHMASEIVKIYRSELFEKYLEREMDFETINYTGSSNSGRFKSINPNQIFYDSINRKEIEGKIVLIGFLGDNSESFKNDEDKRFTPLNKKLLRRTQKDMYSIEVMANIISMILWSNFINEPSFIILWYGNMFLIFSAIIIFNILWIRFDRKSLYLRYCSYIFILILIAVTFFSIAYFNYKLDFRISIFYLLFLPEIFNFYKSKVETLPKRLKGLILDAKNKFTNRALR